MRTLLAAKTVDNLAPTAGRGDPTVAARSALLHMWARVRGRGGCIVINRSGEVGKYVMHLFNRTLFLAGFMPP